MHINIKMNAFEKVNLLPVIEKLTITEGGNNSHLSSVRHFVIEQIKQQVCFIMKNSHFCEQKC